MKDKSYVTMEQKTCFVCGNSYDTGAILLDTRLRERFDRFTTTGLGMCPEHKKVIDDGYVILIGCDASKSEPKDGAHTVDPKKAYRTGSLAYIKPELYRQMFTLDLPPNKVAFSDQSVIEYLEEMKKPTEAPDA